MGSEEHTTPHPKKNNFFIFLLSIGIEYLLLAFTIIYFFGNKISIIFWSQKMSLTPATRDLTNQVEKEQDWLGKSHYDKEQVFHQDQPSDKITVFILTSS